ncbi:hypothetical protein JOB18_001779 [Solea senegalensis]|uniref:Uncharacterized protein n=1 Tax=Solea senegalensis TaxID=28829 RepID=A0AAV6QJ86_SOLSE|nr:hypothetical protein JOB18_001779 [Solea senegalensis]
MRRSAGIAVERHMLVFVLRSGNGLLLLNATRLLTFSRKTETCRDTGCPTPRHTVEALESR